MRNLNEIHKMAITCCVYSPEAKYLITGSADTDIKIWSLNGGLMETLRIHFKAVTRLVLDPFNANLVLSSSLDGSVKMWSLDVMQVLYEYKFYDFQAH
jgi:WD40 repeat protein